jgi:HlyD family secretion protein
VAETVKLTMLRIEPLAQPKTDLVNTPTERVDTRVVEVVFTLAEPAKSRLFPGQVVDVFIDAGAGSK